MGISTGTKITGILVIIAFIMITAGFSANVNANVYAKAYATSELKVFAIGVNSAIQELQLKASQMSNGQIVPVSNFVLNPQNVVQINQPNNLVVFTSTNEPQQIEKVKVTDANDVATDLVASPQGYSIQGLNTGVYTLNAIVNDDGGVKQAYETILVILAPTQQPIQPTEVIKQFVVTDVSVSFDDRQGCSNKPGSGQLPFPYQTRTECEVLDWDKCQLGLNMNIQRCKDLGEKFDDDCEGFANQKECDDAIPICDVNSQPGQPCRDEGDFTDCDPGFRDYGFGCEVVEEETNEETTDEDDDNTSDEEDTGGENPNGEEEDQSCGGEPCTDDEKEDSWTDDEDNADGEESGSDDEEGGTDGEPSEFN